MAMHAFPKPIHIDAFAQVADIEYIFVPGVAASESYHGFEFFGDHLRR